MGSSSDDPIKAGRNALERHAWREAYETLSEADRANLLSADGLRMLAEAAWWSGEPDVVLKGFSEPVRVTRIEWR